MIFKGPKPGSSDLNSSGRRGRVRVAANKPLLTPAGRRRWKRHKKRLRCCAYEPLEPRRVLNAAPVGNHDLLYYTSINSPLQVDDPQAGVLANDFDLEHQIGVGGGSGGGSE